MFHDRFNGNVPHKSQLEVRLISDKVHCKVDFRDTSNTTESKNLLATLSLRPSPTCIDPSLQVGQFFKLLTEIDWEK